jgi:hypothetical protein
MTPAVTKKLEAAMAHGTIVSLDQWVAVAAACRAHGVDALSGTVPAESLWAHLRNVLGLRTQTTLKEDLFEAMGAFVYHRFIFQRAHRDFFPQCVENDSLIPEGLLELQHAVREDAEFTREAERAWWAHSK